MGPRAGASLAVPSASQYLQQPEPSTRIRVSAAQEDADQPALIGFGDCSTASRLGNGLQDFVFQRSFSPAAAADATGASSLDTSTVAAVTVAPFPDIRAVPAGASFRDTRAVAAGASCSDTRAVAAGASFRDIRAVPAGASSLDTRAVPAVPPFPDIRAVPAGAFSRDTRAVAAGASFRDTRTLIGAAAATFAAAAAFCRYTSGDAAGIGGVIVAVADRRSRTSCMP